MSAARSRLMALVSRLAAVALPLGLVAALASGAVVPLLEAADQAKQQADERRALGARYVAIAVEHDRLAAELKGYRAAQSESPLFVGGRTPALAAASLQERLSRIVAEAGGVMHAASGSHDANLDGLEQISVTARFDADIAQLTRILHRIEIETPLLFVDRLSVSGQIRREGGILAARRTLGVSMTLSGYRLADLSGEDRT